MVDNKVVINSLDSSAVNANTASATLSEDKKELTIKAVGSEKFAGRYDIKLAKGDVKTALGEDIAAYSETIKVEDTVAPSILGTEKLTASTVKVKFSEPIADLGTVTFKTASGETVSASGNGVTGSAAFVAGSKEVVFTLGSDVPANSTVTATFVGAKDYAGLLISPNPTSVSLSKGAADGTKPTVSEITPVSPVKFAVKFSELVSGLTTGDFTITAQTGSATVSNIEQDETDKTKYYVTLSGPIQGLTTIALANQAVTDMTGEQSEAVSRVVTFAQDTVAPKVESTKVVRGTDNKEYLEVTFSEEVTKESTLATLAVAGTKTSEFVTSNLTASTIQASDFAAVSGSKTKFRIELATLLGANNTENASYNLSITGKTAASADVSLVKDVVNLGSAASLEAQFVRTKDGSVTSTNKATIDTAVSGNGITVAANNNTVTVSFNGEVDGASAVDINNYKIDGAIVEKAVLNEATGAPSSRKQTVTLTLKADSNTYSGTRYVTVSGVKAKNGLAMDEYKTTESFNENVRPVVTSAKLVGLNKVVVTFSEGLAADAVVSTNDFELVIGGQKVLTNDLVSTPAVGANDKSLELTLETSVTDANVQSGLALKILDTVDLKDLVGNIVSGNQITISK